MKPFWRPGARTSPPRRSSSITRTRSSSRPRERRRNSSPPTAINSRQCGMTRSASSMVSLKIGRPKGAAWSGPPSQRGAGRAVSAEPLLFRGQFSDKQLLAVDLFQRFGDGAGGDDDEAVDPTVVTVLAAHRVEVTVKFGADNLCRGVQHRRARIPWGAVVGDNEVE